jgi:transposase-like protein
MNRDAPPFARYVLLLKALMSAPIPTPERVPAQTPRRAYTNEDRDSFFALRAGGASIGKAAKALGIPSGTAKFWDQVWKGNR